MNPTTLTPAQQADLINQIRDLRAMAKGLRLGSDSPSKTADERDADREKAAAIDRTADGLSRTLAAARDAERAELEAALHAARTRTLYAHRTGNIDDMEAAVGAERQAVMDLVAFNQRHIRMVPVTHVRR